MFSSNVVNLVAIHVLLDFYPVISSHDRKREQDILYYLLLSLGQKSVVLDSKM